MSHRFTRENSTISSGRSPCRSWPRGLVSPTPTWPTRAGRRSSSAHSRSEDLEGRARHPTPPTVEGIGLLFLLPFCSHNTPKQGGTRRRTTHHQTTWHRLLPNAFPARSEGYRSRPSCTHNPKVAGSNPAPATTQGQGVSGRRPLTPSSFLLPFCNRCSVSGHANRAGVAAITEHQPVALPRLRRVNVGHEMSVTVERCLDRCVAELGLDVLRVRPLSDQETRISVAQVVKPDAPKLGAAERPRPVALSEGVVIYRLAVRAAEGEPALEATRELGQRRPQGRR